MNAIKFFFWLFVLSFSSALLSEEICQSHNDIHPSLVTSGNDVKLIVENLTHAPLTIRVFSRTKDTLIKKLFVLPKGKKVISEFSNVTVQVARKTFNENFRMRYDFGDERKIKPTKSYTYRLPFMKGKKYKVGQSFNGNISHQSKQSRYAIDFTLEIGEPVHAARSGRVVKTVSCFKESGDESYRNKANLIIIEHDDGTFAHYVHLEYKGILVEDGEFVVKGQHIGYSGLTGFTKGPHLHFVVRKEYDLAIPIYFDGYEQQVLKEEQSVIVK